MTRNQPRRHAVARLLVTTALTVAAVGDDGPGARPSSMSLSEKSTRSAVSHRADEVRRELR